MARLSTSSGKFVGWGNLPKGTISLWQSVVRKLTGHIPRQPWIPFSARDALSQCLTADSVVWEIGAGYSTLWLSDRVRKLTSIEASKEWFDRLSAVLVAEGNANVDLRFEWEAERMAGFAGQEDASLDLLFIDGGPRGMCLERGFQKVKSGGYLYLDNWDTKHFWASAVDFPTIHADRFSEIRSFVDFVPAQVGVYEGLLLRKA